ncbi:MAG: hypothetical protein DRJ13_13925 [Bacteroidetes bacterium]|nr:MAG: hypothetical protein DRJ13_13925 [Bacteroidota bacterium]
MRTYPECYECVLRQFTSELDLINLDLETQTLMVKEALVLLGEARGSATPPDLYGQLHSMLRDNIGDIDAYVESKRKSHQLAMGYQEALRGLIGNGPDKFEQGIKVSAAGNIIDVLYAREYNLWDEVESSVNQDLLGGGLSAFQQKISKAPYLLYLADNVGETIFDKVFIETLNIPVKYGVKGGPILNDATLEDARSAGIDQIAEIVETGSRSPGTPLDQCTNDFRRLFDESPLVLAKGQANYETLDDGGDKIFFLLRLKCPLISREIGFPHGSLVLKQGLPLN